MRDKPDFGKKVSNRGNSLGFVSLLFIAVIGTLVVSAISRVMSGHGSRDDQYVCYGILICLVLVYFQAEREKKEEEQRLLEVRQKWRNTSKSAEVAIVNRRYSRGGVYEDGYYPGEFHSHRSYYYLDLATNDDQRAIAPNKIIIGVEVSQGVYNHLENRNTVRIYYKPESPLTFLLEEEV